MALLDEAAFMREFTLCTKNEDTSGIPCAILGQRKNIIHSLKLIMR